MLEKRLAKNYQRLKGWIKDQKIQAFRLYDRDIPELPFIIDIYKDLAVVYERSKVDVDATRLQKNQIDIQQSLNKLFPEIKIEFKTREKQKNKTEYQKQDEDKSNFTIEEHGLKFEINPTSYIDVGLFLDHRPLRKQLMNEIKKNDERKSVLNLFSYTCSFGVYAASVGAKTTNIDLSKTYLEWGKRNYLLNDIELKHHRFIEIDIFEFLKNETHRYDYIILDPPSFSNSKKMEYAFDLQKLHVQLVNHCLDLLVIGGKLYFSGNLRNFKLDESLKGPSDGMMVSDISKKTIPLDYRDEKIHFCYEVKRL